MNKILTFFATAISILAFTLAISTLFYRTNVKERISRNIHITGVLYDGSNGNPISEAAIMVDKYPKRVRTDENGKYELNVSNINKWNNLNLLIVKEGYSGKEIKLEIRDSIYYNILISKIE